VARGLRSETENTLSNSISTLLRRSLSDGFGENDPVRRRAAIDEIFHEDAVFYDPKGGLLRYSKQSLRDIALDCGFSSSATFSRAFRSGYDTSPSRFRKSGEIKKSKICKELFPEEEYGLPHERGRKESRVSVRLVDIPERQVAYIRVMMPSDWTEYLPPSRQ
jgi:hypothetical protein